jgi:predicted ATP-dependent serine protease
MSGKAISYNDVKIVEREAVKFGDEVFDNFLSEVGGIELGTMLTLAGTPGAGKTTLCKKLQKDLNDDEISIFYALESRKSSVAKQTKRIKTGGNELICDVEDFPTWTSFMDYLYETKPLLVTVDSIQHAAQLLTDENGKYIYDNYKKVRKDLYEWKDITQGIVVLIAQLNAKGEVEGPMSTVFDVDCPIFLTADPESGERTMHTEKNRMGPIGKIWYEFVDTDACIKFHTQAQWEALKSKGEKEDYLDKIIKDTETYISTLDKKDEKIKSLIKEYKSNIKTLDSIENDAEYLAEYVKMTFLLMNKYGI